MQEMQRKECLHDKLLEMSGRNQDLSQWIPDMMRWIVLKNHPHLKDPRKVSIWLFGIINIVQKMPRHGFAYK